MTLTERYVNISKEFSPVLTNRNEKQGDGRFTGVEFREKYLSELMNEKARKDENAPITLDFIDVQRLDPEWANEAFAYFTKYVTSKEILEKIIFKNITTVKYAIIINEIFSQEYRNKQVDEIYENLYNNRYLHRA